MAFIEVLQERLDACPLEDGLSPARGGFPVPPLGFFFDPGFRPTTYSRLSAKRWQPSPPPRPRRVLLPRDQRALDYLVGLGARLGPDFTSVELRSAFRALAREYHPDRYPDSRPQQKERLSVLFRRLRQAYEHLLGTVAAA